MELNAMAQAAWDGAEAQGLHTNLDTLPLREATLIRLALVFTEVAEATQLVKRHGIFPPDSPSARSLLRDLAEEFADVLIRLGDLAVCLQIDLNEAVDHKLAANTLRPYRYGTPGEFKA